VVELNGGTGRYCWAVINEQIVSTLSNSYTLRLSARSILIGQVIVPFGLFVCL